MTRPRPWSTGDVGSFAHRTLAVRVPKILDDTVARNRFPTTVLARLRALRDELTAGTLRALGEDAADRAAWDVECAPHVGKSWLDVPWYFAESFFYRRVLECTRYFDDGKDPWLAHKLEEEATVLERLAPIFRDDLRDDLSSLLGASLWGNRADLSYIVGRAHGESGGADDLLVDDRAPVRELLGDAQSVGIVLDNAGTELACDLLLADHLAKRARVVLYAKMHPFFVSDATCNDIERTTTLLGLTPPVEMRVYPFMTSSRFLFTSEMPPDLTADLSSHDIVIVKGDANYRRLVGDAPWPHATPFAEAIEFPAPLVALRTFKAEVAVGLSEDVVERARKTDPDWLVSGRFGVIQASLRRRADGPQSTSVLSQRGS